MQFPGKLIKTKLEKLTKKLILGPILAHLAQIWGPNFFLWVVPLLVVRDCSKLSSYAIERKTNKTKLEKSVKNLILGPIWPKFGPPKFFRGLYLYYMLYIVPRYHCMSFQGKLMNQT